MEIVNYDKRQEEDSVLIAYASKIKELAEKENNKEDE